ncbi:MAG TPA: SufD family Fe-S cluster assembly protein [Candidatus Desulfofervidus auxilii]|mgnify:CR=1 FL=1|uniref:SufD family Fe-S cluster assembly protein n=1 Tax=Desulfofervidus auxilii TaxID=1621989 RepID=A0A7C0Y357_DESA2|nr:SufD family Fe-S cluster assembly protein [Candidatus Desulfofervidus auxilii]
MNELKEIREKAEKAINKKAVYGQDINIETFRQEAEKLSISEISHLSEEEQKKMLETGIEPEGKERAGSYFQIDHSVVHYEVAQEGVEILSIEEALAKYEWLKEYWWKALSVDMDKYTAHVALYQKHGYFIRVLPGVKTAFPLQACLFMSQEGLIQSIHNIIICEEGSELNLITGCAASHRIRTGLHLGISEFFIKKGATCIFTMIHNWAEEMAIRPRTGIIVEEGGTFVSNYILLKKVADLQTFPTAYLKKDARAEFNNILLAPEGSHLDTGTKVFLKEEGCRAEVISRSITTGGTIIARGHLIGEAPGIKAHLECKGLILGEKGIIHAIPELEGHVGGVEMSHEAAVGKIAQDQIEYLMARGLSETEATSLIVRGFLRVDIKGLPPELKTELDKAIEVTEKDVM